MVRDKIMCVEFESDFLRDIFENFFIWKDYSRERNYVEVLER